MPERTIGLVAGRLTGDRFTASRSGFRWLCRDGDVVRPGQIIAYCSILLNPVRGFRVESSYFGFQVAVASSVGGRLRAPTTRPNGYFDILGCNYPWSPDEKIAELVVAGDVPEGAAQLRLMGVVGRRYLGVAEVPVGMAQGWCDRRRAWWGAEDAPRGSIVVAGLCATAHMVAGAELGFVEMFEESRGPAHICVVPSDVVVPTALTLLEQFERTSADCERMVEDALTHAGSSSMDKRVAGPASTRIAECLGTSIVVRELIQPSPLLEPQEMLVSGNMAHIGVDAIVVSLHSERTTHYRHRRLGHTLGMHSFRPEQVGWSRGGLAKEYEIAPRTADDTKRDYIRLFDAIRARSDAHLIVTNIIAQGPLTNTVTDTNLALYDAARERDISIVDIDALAADMGLREQSPDGSHYGGALEQAARAELYRVLQGRGVPGFG